jgi:hypothetical protein
MWLKAIGSFYELLVIRKSTIIVFLYIQVLIRLVTNSLG